MATCRKIGVARVSTVIGVCASNKRELLLCRMAPALILQQGIGLLGLCVQACLQDGWGAGAAIAGRQPCLTHRAQAQLSPCSEHPDGNLATIGCHDLVEWHLSGMESLQGASSRSGLAPAAVLLSVGCCFVSGLTSRPSLWDTRVTTFLLMHSSTSRA